MLSHWRRVKVVLKSTPGADKVLKWEIDKDRQSSMPGAWINRVEFQKRANSGSAPNTVIRHDVDSKQSGPDPAHQSPRPHNLCAIPLEH
jgi:hypothetical protein